jgi:uncharacterized protein (UPF0276 family)
MLEVRLAHNPSIRGEHQLSSESNILLPNKDFLGFGLGLRTDHFQDVLSQKPDLDWFEVVSENFMVDGGKPKYYLHAIRELYPMVMHGVSLSIGSTDPLNFDYLRQLKVLINELQPEWVSDHLCWTGAHQKNSHDLLPLPYNEEALAHVCQRVEQVQEFLGRPILLENLSSYITYKNSEMSEWQFFNEVARRSGCEILLDINNIYVSARNHDFNPQAYLDGIDTDKVKQFHLAGHNNYGDYVIDTHDHPVADPGWDLYRKALKRFGWVSTMIERDDNIPPLSELLAEVCTAKKIALETLGPLK